jgi:hypothetical protein
VHRLDRDHRRLDSLTLQLAHGLGDETTGSIVCGRRVKGSQSQYMHRWVTVENFAESEELE